MSWGRAVIDSAVHSRGISPSLTRARINVARFAIEQMVDRNLAGRLLHRQFDFGLRQVRHLERKGDVLVDRPRFAASRCGPTCTARDRLAPLRPAARSQVPRSSRSMQQRRSSETFAASARMSSLSYPPESGFCRLVRTFTEML